MWVCPLDPTHQLLFLFQAFPRTDLEPGRSLPASFQLLPQATCFTLSKLESSLELGIEGCASEVVTDEDDFILEELAQDRHEGPIWGLYCVPPGINRLPTLARLCSSPRVSVQALGGGGNK